MPNRTVNPAQCGQSGQQHLPESEIAPYKGVGESKGHDWRSLISVIRVLRNKFRQAFKSSQFTLGPTFALALLDRLVLPGGHSRACAILLRALSVRSLHKRSTLARRLRNVSGTPISEAGESEGAPTLEGLSTEDGLFTDQSVSFPGVGLIPRSTRILGVALPMVSQAAKRFRVGLAI